LDKNANVNLVFRGIFTLEFRGFHPAIPKILRGRRIGGEFNQILCWESVWRLSGQDEDGSPGGTKHQSKVALLPNTEDLLA